MGQQTRGPRPHGSVWVGTTPGGRACPACLQLPTGPAWTSERTGWTPRDSLTRSLERPLRLV